MPLQMMVQTSENGMLVLLGSMFFPLLPALGIIGNVFTFYVRLAVAFYINDAPKMRTSGLQHSTFHFFLFAGEISFATTYKL